MQFRLGKSEVCEFYDDKDMIRKTLRNHPENHPKSVPSSDLQNVISDKNPGWLWGIPEFYTLAS